MGAKARGDEEAIEKRKEMVEEGEMEVGERRVVTNFLLFEVQDPFSNPCGDRVVGEHDQ